MQQKNNSNSLMTRGWDEQEGPASKKQRRHNVNSDALTFF